MEHDEESDATEGAVPRVLDSNAGAEELEENEEDELERSREPLDPLEPLERLELALPDLSDLSLPVALSELPCCLGLLRWDLRLSTLDVDAWRGIADGEASRVLYV